MTQLLTYLDPVMYVRIADYAGNTRFFGAGKGSEGERSNEGRILAGVTVTESRKGNMVAQVRFTPPSRDVEEFLSDPILSIGNIAEISWGYSAWGLRRVYGALSVPDVSLAESAEITLNINGMLLGVMRRSKRRVWRVVPENPQSASMSGDQIISEIAGDKGFGLTIDYTKANGDIFKQPEKGAWVQSGQTDWEFIRYIADQYECESFLQDNILVIADRTSIRDGDAPVVATFRRFGQLDMQKNIYPIVGFSSENFGNAMGLFARGILQQSFDPDEGPDASATRTEDTSKVASDTGGTMGGPPKTLKIPFSGASGIFVDKEFDAEREAGAIVCLPDRQEGKEHKKNGQFVEAQNLICSAQVDTLGLPFIFPSQLVKVEGVGRLFDKIYEVDEVVHEVGAGYDMSMKVVTADLVAESEYKNSAKEVKNPEPKADPRTTLVEAE